MPDAITIHNVKGMSRKTGQFVDQVEHINQSIKDILTTPIGSRVMRREYGSLLPFLIDAPMNSFFSMQLRASIMHAIMRWEHRVTPTRIELQTDGDGISGIGTIVVEYQFIKSKKTAKAYLQGGAL